MRFAVGTALFVGGAGGLTSLLLANESASSSLWGEWWYVAFFGLFIALIVLGMYIALSWFVALPMPPTLDERRRVRAEREAEDTRAARTSSSSTDASAPSTGEGDVTARVVPRSEARSPTQSERDEVSALPDRPARVDLVQEARELLRRADAFNENNRQHPIQRETLRSALQPLYARGREIALAAGLAEAGDRYADVKALREWTASVEATLEGERFEGATNFFLYTALPPPSLQERSGNFIGAFLEAMRSDAVQRRELQQLATERVQRLHALIEVLRDEADPAGSGVDRDRS